MTRCADHNTPTHPGHTNRSKRHCSGCDKLMPYWHELEPLPVISSAWTTDLRVATGDLNVWTSRCGIDDGEPYERTVYVELLDDDRGWIDIGHYDGDNPPRGLPGVTPHMLRGELTHR